MGGLTFAAGPITALSANPVLAAPQIVLGVLLMPGLFVAAMCGFFLPGALLNAVFHFGLCWLLFRLFIREKPQREWRAGEKSD
jgi:uncharacterized membrane protein YfcA